MIAEKTVQFASGPPNKIGNTDTGRPAPAPGTAEPALKTSEPDLSQADLLESLAADIRRDAKDQALFYLVRSNTGYDGE